MEGKLKNLFGLMAALTVLTGCHRNFSVDTVPPGIVEREATSLEKSLAVADNQFGFRLFHQLNIEAADSNCFISPFSVSMALGMTLNGAAGETEQAMRRTLELTGLTQDEINETYRSLMELLPCQDAGVRFQIANSIWYRENYPVQDTFIDVNQTFFNAAIREMDFSRPDAKDIINEWILQNTGGRIKKALDFIPPEIVMYLINAIYFKGAWLFEFDPQNTYAADFTTPYGSRTCQMMSHPEATLMYFRTDDFQAVDLPYGNGKFSMSVFLPAAGLSVDDFITQFTDTRWKQWIVRFDSTTIQLGLPKFKVEYGTLLNDVLTTMGMGVAFTGAADFSRINPGGGLYISRVIHKTFVEVNEEGTEAAAVTIVEMLESASPATARMIVDRPFVFVIWDHTTGAILFIGKIVEPTLG
jgi:serine protease inhibitor